MLLLILEKYTGISGNTSLILPAMVHMPGVNRLHNDRQVCLWLVRSISGSFLGSSSVKSSPKSKSIRVPLDVVISVKAPSYLVGAFEYSYLHRVAPLVVECSVYFSDFGSVCFIGHIVVLYTVIIGF